MVRELNMDIHQTINETCPSRWKGNNGRHTEGFRYGQRNNQSTRADDRYQLWYKRQQIE